MTSLKKVCQLILLAQTASNGGKYCGSNPQNTAKAAAAGYSLKDLYISQAAALSKKTPGVKVSTSVDMENCPGMTVVYFDILGVGQVSFHSFRRWRNLPTGGKWDRRLGGSMNTCKKLARRFNLQF